MELKLDNVYTDIKLEREGCYQQLLLFISQRERAAFEHGFDAAFATWDEHPHKPKYFESEVDKAFSDYEASRRPQGALAPKDGSRGRDEAKR